MPPLPGKIPNFTSGNPMRAVSSMMRMSQASAISAPPPSVTPLSAAITGTGNCSSAANASFSRASLRGTTFLAHMCEFANIGAGAEGLAPHPHHHDDPNPLVAGDVPAGSEEPVEGDKRGEVERRIVEREHRDAPRLHHVIC